MIYSDWVKSLTVIFLVLLSVSANSQSRYIKNYSVGDGLSQSEVSDVIEDDSGVFFLNTGAIGVDLFNGVEFKRIGLDDGLSSEFVLRLFKDSNGDVWFISRDGLDLYRKNDVSTIAFSSDVGQLEIVFAVAEKAEHVLLLGTRKGLVEVDLISGSSSRMYADLGVVYSLRVEGEDLTLTTSDGIWRIVDGKKYKQRLPDSETEWPVYCQIKSSSGKEYFGTNGGVFIKEEEDTRYKRLDALNQNAVIAMLETSDGDLLFGTNGSGVYMLHQDGQWSVMTEENGLADDYIWNIIEDRNRNVWLGTSGGGVDILTAEHFNVYSTHEGILGDIVYDIHEDDQGRIWIGTVQGGISILEDDKIKTFDTRDGLNHRTVRCFHQTNDTIWIGTETGVTIYHQGRFEDMSQKVATQDLVVFDIHQDSEGHMWFACKGERFYGPSGGLVKWDGVEVTIYNQEDGLADDNIGCLFEDENGLWLGTDLGLTLFDGTSFKEMNFPENEPCKSQVISVLKDSRGNHWVGSIGGLGLIRDGEYHCFTGEMGLRANMVFLLQLQGDSVLWVGSSEGLEKIDLNAYYENGQLSVVYYNENSGFYGTECNQNAVCEDSQGRFWFGTIKGAVCYDPKKDKSLMKNVPLIISEFKLNGDEVNWNMREADVDQKYGLPVRPKLKYNENNVMFEFVGINPVNPRGVTYSWRLEGLGESWSRPSVDRVVNFSNLSAGQYSFQVRSSNLGSGELIYSAPFEFSIVPALWQRTWFQFILLLLLIASVFWMFYMRVKSIERREIMKQEFNAQLLELEMTALRSQMNPHFLFNSLNSVNHFIIKNNKKEASAYLTKFSRLVRMVLQNSKETQVTLRDELQALSLFIELESLRFDKAFSHQLKVEAEIDTAQYLIPPLLLQPYVENAIWHGLLHLKEKKAMLWVHISPIENGLFICIEDNGVGRQAAEQFKSKTASQKKSLGMKINEDRINLTERLYNSKTKIHIRDLFGKKGEARGTRVELTIEYHD